MMWARKHRFGLSTPWFLHCRLDASLQFGRDYMMSEVDIVSPANVSSWQGVGGDGVLYTRLLVGQTLGARASGVVVKTKKLLHQLSLASWILFQFQRLSHKSILVLAVGSCGPRLRLQHAQTNNKQHVSVSVSLSSIKESETLSGTLCRCLSLLFDWGAESHVWKSPASFIRESLPFDTLFGMALPLPDGDHALHHVTFLNLFAYFFPLRPPTKTGSGSCRMNLLS